MQMCPGSSMMKAMQPGSARRPRPCHAKPVYSWMSRPGSTPVNMKDRAAARPTVYLESSVISYLASRPSRDVIIAGRQVITNDWWENQRERFDLRISPLVDEEIERGDPAAAERRKSLIEEIPSLSITDQSMEIAEFLLKQDAVPPGSEVDALHIGIAVSQGVDYLLTWNFKHINNAERKIKISRVIEELGLTCPQICSPEELGGTSSD